MKKTIKWGILGYAGIARKHVIPAMKKAYNAEPYAIASRSKDKLAAAVKEFGFQKAYDSYDELLQDPTVEAVYIPLPNALHKEWTIKAAYFGKHILCEKPLALTEDDCNEMIAACKEHKVKLMEAMMYRFSARTKKMQELLKADVIGEIKHINSTFRFLLTDSSDVRVNKELGGGSLRDVGCYPINIIRFILNDYPVSFCAKKVEFQGVDSSLTAILKFKNGVIATASAGFDSKSAQLTEINGTKGSMIIRDSFIDTESPILVISGLDGTVTEYKVEACERYRLQVEEFSDAVLYNRAPVLNLSEVVSNNKLIEEILKAAE